MSGHLHTSLLFCHCQTILWHITASLYKGLLVILALTLVSLVLRRVLKLEVGFTRAPHFEQQVDHVFSEGLGPTYEHHAPIVARWQEAGHLLCDQFSSHASMVHCVTISHLSRVVGEGIHRAPAQGVRDVEVPVALEVVQLLFE